MKEQIKIFSTNLCHMLLGKEIKYNILKEEFRLSKGKLEGEREFKCFVIMPIGKKGTIEYENNMAVYNDIIKPCLDNSGYKIKCYYADVINESGLIDKQAIIGLRDDDIVIADLRRSNPSVAYELGVRHAFFKRSILVNSFKTKKWFYTEHYRVFEYKIDGTSNKEFFEKLISSIEDIITNPNKPDNPVSNNLTPIEEISPISEELKTAQDSLNIGSSAEIEFNIQVSAGRYYVSIKRYDLAIACFEKALRLKPGNISLHLELSIIYGETLGDPGSKKLALKHCEDALAIDPNNISAKFNSAIYTNHLKGSSLSLPIYLEAEKMIKLQGLEGREIEGKLNLFIGHDYKNSGEKLEAEKRYDRAILILKKLAEQGDRTSAFWLANAEQSLKDLLGKITIVSDEKTIFIGSTFTALKINKKSVEAQEHHLWKKSDGRYPELEGAKWIADRPVITNDEALKGGKYTFLREFNIDFGIAQLRSAEICLLVDDFCKITVNGVQLEEARGYEELHRFDIKKHIKEGKNTVKFRVENISAESNNDPAINIEFYKSNEKFLYNPYGLKYAITIEYGS